MAEISGVQHLRRRGSFVLLNLFVGSTGEVCGDTTYLRTSIGDGVTPGGWFSAKGGASVQSLLYTASGKDATVYGATSINTVNVKLPPAASYPSGQRLTVADNGLEALTPSSLIIQSANSGEKIIGLNVTGGGIINSTQVTVGLNGYGFHFVALSTVPGWAFWY